VSVLANRLVTSLKFRQPELDVSERDIKCITLAGLCHDLGHGPFSHAFEDWIHRQGKSFAHEDMSLKIIEHLVDTNSIDIDREDVRFIKSLIAGEPYTSVKNERDDGRMWMYDIVANKRNSIDVDKWDYLARDCYNLGIKSSYDHSRLMTYSKVIENEICYHAKEAYNIYEMFHTRYSLFKQVYSHRVGKAIEYMIGDAFRLADPYLHISEAVEDVELYSTLLTDNLLRTIESSREPEMKLARDIVRRIRTRDLYKMVDEVLISPQQIATYQQGITPHKVALESELICSEGGLLRSLTATSDSLTPPVITIMTSSGVISNPDDYLNNTPPIQSSLHGHIPHRRNRIFSHSEATSLGPLQESLLRIDTFTCNYALKDRNPVDSVHFFSKWDDTKSFRLEKEKVSLLIPDTFSERYLRVFVTDPMQTSLAQLSFRQLLKKIGDATPGPQHTITRSNTPASITSTRKRRERSLSDGTMSSSSITTTSGPTSESAAASPAKRPKLVEHQ
jgi:HD superfamily phosphohydrolase